MMGEGSIRSIGCPIIATSSVTRLADLLDFGQLFKALGIFCKGVKIHLFSSEIILGNFYRHLAIFSGHTGTHSHGSLQTGRGAIGRSVDSFVPLSCGLGFESQGNEFYIF